jgi:hypothetical protein
MQKLPPADNANARDRIGVFAPEIALEIADMLQPAAWR